MKKKYLWYTDTHFGYLSFYKRWKFIHNVKQQNPQGIFLTGDIANGLHQTIFNLKYFAEKFDIPIYYVIGNHDVWFSSLEEAKHKLIELNKKYPNLIWLTQKDPIRLDDEVALIGTDNWYNPIVGNSYWLKYTLDWLLIKNFRTLPSMEKRIEAFKALSDYHTKNIKNKLQQALDLDYKTIYILTHMPPWLEATRDEGTILETFWLPYNTNIQMGKEIEDIMEDRKKRRVVVLSGHTHSPMFSRISRNVECQVGAAHYVGSIHSQKVYL